MSTTPQRSAPGRRRPAAALAAAVLAVALGACGAEERPTASGGRQVFEQAGCGNCHALADAGASGSFGPNLDELQPSVARIERQVRTGGEGMPAYEDRLTPDQIRAVAEYIARATRKEDRP